jgi:hypothetical protein
MYFEDSRRFNDGVSFLTAPTRHLAHFSTVDHPNEFEGTKQQGQGK